MVGNLIAAFGKRIDAIAWMTPETKAHAKAKLAGLKSPFTEAPVGVVILPLSSTV